MRIEQLRYLLHIAESGSISRSAEALSISQQGLSQTMHQLERELDVKLLYREGNRTKLTAIGKQLRGDMESILQSYDDMLDAIAASTSAGQREKQFCHIRVTPHFCITAMPNIIQRMGKLYPNLLLNVMESQFLELLQGSSFENDEIFILTCPERFLSKLVNRPGVLGFHEMYRCRIQAVLPASHPLADSSCITVDDMCRYPVTLLGSDIEMLRNIAGKRFSSIRIRLHTTNFELYRAAIGLRNNIALSVPLAFERMRSPDLRYIPLEGAETIVYGYIVNAYAQSSPLNIELLNLLESEMQKLQPAP